MAREDRSPVVRLYLASALQRLNLAERWSVAGELVMHAEDAADQNVPKMVWLGVEPLVAENPPLALERSGRGGIPLVAQFVARRAVDADALEPLVAAIGTTPKMLPALLEGMRDGLEGRIDLVPPTNWTPTFDRLKKSSDVRVARLIVEVARQFGDTEAARRNLTAVRTSSVPIGERQKALQTLAAQRRPELVPELPRAMDDAPLRIDAIRAIAAFDDESLGKLLIARFQTFNAAEKAEAVQTLASRGRYGRMLTDALASGAIAKRDVPSHAARQLRRVVGVRFADVWGPIDDNAGEDRAYARYRGMLTESAIAGANLPTGRAIFQRTCGACHKLYGEGGTIGPDLTGSNRANLEYVLSNVLNPSGEVQDAYKMVIVTTRDGRTHSGNVASETDRQLTLRVVGRDPIAINKADIQAREATAASMMPPGLFDPLADREVIDLVAYLRTLEQVKIR